MNEEGGRRLDRRLPGGLTLRALVPNAITAAALCLGLTGVRFAIDGQFDKAVILIIVAGMLDGIDGRIARLLRAQSRFGAELDSLADSINFGVGPALVVYLWSLQDMPRFGWFATLAFALACVLRLARFNARIDMINEPKKAAGFLTGVPAPVGAGLAFLPFYLSMISDDPRFGDPRLMAAWLVVIAFLMISNVPTLSWSRMRPRRSVRLELIALAGLLVAALVTEPWWTLAGISVAYLVLIPVGLIAYTRVRRQRGAASRATDATSQP